MERTVYDDLLRWKRSSNRRPLLLEGIKQAGKDHILRYFGEKNYNDTAYFNFRDDPDLSDIFTKHKDPRSIIRELGSVCSKNIDEKTLVILDEIQFCNEALMSMRLFHKGAPEFHIACAGSMGMMLSGPDSFPVGAVERIRIGPKDYANFLAAERTDDLLQ